MLKSIANELKVLSKPDLFNQIMGASLLPTNSAAVAQIKRLADETARVADGLDRLADNAYSKNFNRKGPLSDAPIPNDIWLRFLPEESADFGSMMLGDNL
jgi:hypothetical protein